MERDFRRLRAPVLNRSVVYRSTFVLRILRRGHKALTQKEIFEFGPYRLDVGEHTLVRADPAVALKPKVFETLVLLVRNAGHLLSKQELMSALWPEPSWTRRT